MEGREDQVPGQGGLDGDLNGLLVADFSNQDRIRVLAQDRPQGGGKGQALLGVDLDLVHPLERVLDRILYRDDIVFNVEDLANRRIESC